MENIAVLDGYPVSPVPFTKWMIHPVTNMVMAYNRQLVLESGYRPYNGPLPVVDPEKGFRVMHDDTEFETEVSLKEKEKQDKELKIFRTHCDKIFEAMKAMKPVEFITANGMPKIKSIEKAVGFLPTMEEREKAFEIFTEWKESQIVESSKTTASEDA